MKEEERLDRMTWLIIAIFLLIIIGLATIETLFFEKPQFTITKEECHNESIEIGKKLVNITKISCNSTIEYRWTNGEYNKECMNEEKKEQYPCDDLVCVYSLSSDTAEYLYEIEIKKESYSYDEEIWTKIETTKEVCEKVEVDKMFDFKTPDIDCVNYWCWSINKEDLTFKYLNTNCECIYFEDEQHYSGHGGPCSKYKCGNYEVKVE